MQGGIVSRFENSARRWTAAVVFLIMLFSLSWVPRDLHAQQAGPPPAGAPVYAPGGHIIEWDPAIYGDPAIFSIDGYRLRLFSRKSGTDHPPLPVLDVTAPTGEEYEIAGQEGFDDARAFFGVGKLDPGNPGEEVMFQTYSGGAHCCTRIDILELQNGRWENATVHNGDRFLDAIDGEGFASFPVDLDGNGVPDLDLRDDDFRYQFDCYACGWSPAKFFEVHHGKLQDVSDAPRYAPLFKADMEMARELCVRHMNGGCAGFAADAARIGQFDQVWPVILQNYDPQNHTVPSAPCELAHNCPADFRHPAFPEALKLFLTEHGYLKSK